MTEDRNSPPSHPETLNPTALPHDAVLGIFNSYLPDEAFTSALNRNDLKTVASRLNDFSLLLQLETQAENQGCASPDDDPENAIEIPSNHVRIAYLADGTPLYLPPSSPLNSSKASAMFSKTADFPDPQNIEPVIVRTVTHFANNIVANTGSLASLLTTQEALSRITSPEKLQVLKDKSARLLEAQKQLLQKLLEFRTHLPDALTISTGNLEGTVLWRELYEQISPPAKPQEAVVPPLSSS